jgi:hypothetical protein
LNVYRDTANGSNGNVKAHHFQQEERNMSRIELGRLGRLGRIVAGLGALALAAMMSMSAFAQAASFTANLAGGNEVPPNGSVNTGATFVRVDATTGVITWNTNSSIPQTSVTGHHIHSGIAGANGPIVANFGGLYTGTVTVPVATAAGIVANPAGFYVNLHTAAFPGGELRGQLAVLPAAGVVPALDSRLLGLLVAALAVLGTFVYWRSNRA